ncbi:hypothetical protein [Nocardioides pacificus]
MHPHQPSHLRAPLVVETRQVSTTGAWLEWVDTALALRRTWIPESVLAEAVASAEGGHAFTPADAEVRDAMIAVGLAERAWFHSARGTARAVELWRSRSSAA